MRSIGCGPVARTHHVLEAQSQPKTTDQNQGCWKIHIGYRNPFCENGCEFEG